MEYLSFGKALERCRFRFLNEMKETQSALLLGDGDGRFAAQLLRIAPLCRLHAVDGSYAMLQALQTRCGAGYRVSIYQADLATALPDAVTAESFDLVATHFFLDCLTTTETDALVQRVKPLLRPGACWVVSEFDVPRGAMHVPSALIVRALYVSFRTLTGLQTQRLPNYHVAMERNGFVCCKRVTSMGGLLVSEWWTAEPRVRHEHTL
jgi:trans-aconitate methyltransferase